MAKNLIGASWCDASDGMTITITNPATNEVIDTVPESTKEDCDRAVEAEKLAQKEWRKLPVWERAEILMKFVSLVERDKDELAKLLSDETGKPITEAVGEISMIDLYLKIKIGCFATWMILCLACIYLSLWKNRH